MKVEIYPVGGQPDPDTTFSVLGLGDARQTLICQVEATVSITGVAKDEAYFKALKDCLSADIDDELIFDHYVHVIREG